MEKDSEINQSKEFKTTIDDESADSSDESKNSKDNKNSKSDDKYESSDRSEKSTEKRKKPAAFFSLEEPKTDKKKSLFETLEKPETDSEKNEDIQEVPSFINQERQIDIESDQSDEEPGMDNGEVSDVALQLISERETDIKDELEDAEPDSMDEFQALAGAAFIESLRNTAEQTEQLTEESIQQAVNEALDDMMLDQDVDEAQESDVQVLETDIEGEQKDNPDDEETLISSQAAVAPVAQTNANSTSSSNQNNSGNTNTPPPIPNPNPNNPNNPNNNNNNNSQPPPPPPGPGSPYNPNIYNNNQNFNNYSPPANPNTSNQTIIHNTYINRRRRGRDMLIGGLIGYVVGRRGGRKRTEKKLVPKIDKLEKQVTKLHDSVIEAEDKVRRLAIKSAEAKPDESLDISKIVERRKKKAEIKDALEKRKELLQNPKVEKMGIFSLPALKVFRERRLIDGNENNPQRKRVEVMTVPELIEKLGNKKVDDEIIVEMYKKGRISESAMRKITAEYLRSGPYESTFRKELLPDPEILKKNRESVDRVYAKSGTNAGNNHDGELTHNSPISSDNGIVNMQNNANMNNEPKKLVQHKLQAVVAITVLLFIVLLLMLS